LNAMLSSMRRHHITRVVLSLLMIALVAGTIGCVGEASRTVKYELTIASGEGGSVTEPGEGTFTVDSGRVVDLVATPTSGYRFLNWTGNLATIANPNAASTSITMNGNYSITANFEETDGTYYTLTVGITGSGSTGPAAGQHSYAAGAVISISATPTGGYHFVNWTGNVGSVANVNAASTTITMNDDYSIVANFEQTAVTYYTLTIAATGSGSTSPAVAQHTYAAGTVVPIIATPAAGQYFVNWTGNVGTIANVNAASTTITMTGNYSITANFEVAVPYTLTMAVAGAGSTSPAVGQHTYTAGTSVPITATPTGSYSFSHWAASAGSFNNASSATTTFTMPGQDVTVTANFVEGPPIPPDQHTLTMAVVGSGSTSPTVGQHTYTAGTSVPIVATPSGGYQFINWTATAGSFTNANSATTAFTMPAQAATVTAHFGLIPPSQYSLAISSTAGGSVTTPGEGTFTRNAGTAVSLVASPGTGYRFANWIGHVGTIGDLRAASTAITMNGNYEITAVFAPRFMTAAGGYHTVGLRAAGTVVAVGYNGNGQCDVGGWTNIIQVAAGDLHSVGLRSNGTVIAVGDNSKGQCNVGSWANIVQVAAGAHYTVGLRADGTVVATGDNSNGQCNVGGWTNIIQVSAGSLHTLGLESDGTAVAVGYNYHGQCNIASWTGIIQVSAGLYHSVGLKSDGTVVAVGDNGTGQSGVSGWTNVIQVSAGWLHTIGLKANGTVVAVGYNGYGQCNVGSWTNIVQVSADQRHTVGLRSDGTAVAVGYESTAQCNVGTWDLN
jgi:hypothetical protein